MQIVWTPPRESTGGVEARAHTELAWLGEILQSPPALCAFTSLSFICKNSHGATWTTKKESGADPRRRICRRFPFRRDCPHSALPLLTGAWGLQAVILYLSLEFGIRSIQIGNQGEAQLVAQHPVAQRDSATACRTTVCLVRGVRSLALSLHGTGNQGSWEARVSPRVLVPKTKKAARRSAKF